MALGDYLSSLNLDPTVTAKLTTIASPTVGPADDYAPPTPEEMQRYGATPAEQAAAQRYNTPAALPPQAATNPVQADPNWDPKKEAAATAEEDRKRNADQLPDIPDDEGGASPRQSPGVYTPAHWQPGSRSETIQHGIDESKLEPGQRLRLLGAQHGEQSIEATQEAAAHEAAGDVAYAQAHAEASQQAAARQQAIENEKQAYTIREHEKLDALNTAAQQQVDPEAAKGSLGAQVLAALSVGLGQFGASLNGGPNTALQIVNSSIDRRIAAQQFNINNAHKSLANEQSLYKDNLAAFGDKERAALATKMQYIEQAKLQLDQVYAGAKSKRNEAQYHAMREGLDEKYAQYADQFGIRTADQIATSGNEHFVPGQTTGGGAGKKDLENLVTLPNGTTVQAANKEQQNKIIEQARIVDRLQRMNNRAAGIRKELADMSAVNPLNQGDRSKRMAELEDMEIEKTSLLSGKDGEGVQRDSEFARNVAKRGFFTNGAGRFGGIGYDRGTADANLKAQNERAERDMTAFATAGGAHIVKRGKAHDANGNIVPVASYTGKTAKNDEQLAPNGSKPMKEGTKLPTADKRLEETTPDDEDFGFVPTASGGIRKATKGEKGVKVGKRKK